MDLNAHPTDEFVYLALVTGFHQKCHLPNIPASALELSTPWNCSYCQKGIKCPYLTESLDVLQNLLSDDEGSGTEDNTDATNTFDSDHYEPAVVDESPGQVSPRKKRVCYYSGSLCILIAGSYMYLVAFFCFYAIVIELCVHNMVYVFM